MLQEVRALTRRLEVPLVVNDRPDLAVLVEADFVHVGQDDLPVEAARRFDLSRRPVDACAGGARRDRRRTTSASGPVYETPTKAGSRRRRAGVRALRRRPRAAAVVRDRGHRRDERRRCRRRRSERIAVVRAIDGRAGPGARSRLAARSLARTDRYDGSAVWRSPVAQLAEHPAVNRRVVGSSPTRGVRKAPQTRGFSFRKSQR